MYLNKAIIIGNLTRDPEMKAIPSGMKVTTFSLATNRVWKDQSGAKKESTDYHNIVVFGRQAETSAQWLKKGASALVEGRLQTRSWDQDGQKKYRTEIIADRVQFGPKASGNSEGGSNFNQSAGTSTQKEQPLPPESEIDTIEYPEEELGEDIPF